jgi:hypothetical protein
MKLIKEIKSRAVLFENNIIYMKEINLKKVAFDKFINNSCFSLSPLGTNIILGCIFSIKYLDE